MILHVGTPGFDLPLLAAVAFAVAGSAVLLGLSLGALHRRRSRSYLLVSLALAALFARAGVAATAMAGALGPASHHLLEHGLDAAMAALVIAAVYHARTVERRVETASGGTADGETTGGEAAGWEAAGEEAEPREVRGDGGPHEARENGGRRETRGEARSGETDRGGDRQ